MNARGVWHAALWMSVDDVDDGVPRMRGACEIRPVEPHLRG